MLDKEIDLEINDVKQIFKLLSRFMHKRSREETKYWSLIITSEYVFIYHFFPQKSVSFEGNTIKEFVKYLDVTNLLKFISRFKTDCVLKCFKKLPEEDLELLRESCQKIVFCFYDKNNTKGMRQLIEVEPEYEFKGDLRIRVKKSDKTDVVVETFLTDLKNIKSYIEFDFERCLASINIRDAQIVALTVREKEYDCSTGLRKLLYEKLCIGEFIGKYLFKKNDNVAEETKHKVILGEEVLDKPETELDNKEETIFILGDSVNNHENLIKECVDSIKNNFNIAFVELSTFNANYERVDIGDLTVFTKIKKDNIKFTNFKKLSETVLSQVKDNTILHKTLYYVSLLVLCESLISSGFRDKIYQISKNALTKFYSNIRAGNIELKQIEKIGIEFKAGILNTNQGFFDSSPSKLAEKLIKKIRRKKSPLIIFFIGINEDTRDFSLIPLDRVRNEFHETLKEHLVNNVLLSETIPINEHGGILILVLQK